MNSPEFKTLRESLGLSAQWLANQAGVKLRTIQYWESGRSEPKEDVVNYLLSVDSMFDVFVDQVHGAIDTAEEKLGELPERVDLIRYRTDEELWTFRPDMNPLPTTAHAVILARVRKEVLKRGVKVAIHFMDSDVYLDWLAGRQDSESMRAAWAASQ